MFPATPLVNNDLMNQRIESWTASTVRWGLSQIPGYIYMLSQVWSYPRFNWRPGKRPKSMSNSRKGQADSWAQSWTQIPGQQAGGHSGAQESAPDQCQIVGRARHIPRRNPGLKSTGSMQVDIVAASVEGGNLKSTSSFRLNAYFALTGWKAPLQVENIKQKHRTRLLLVLCSNGKRRRKCIWSGIGICFIYLFIWYFFFFLELYRYLVFFIPAYYL